MNSNDRLTSIREWLADLEKILNIHAQTDVLYYNDRFEKYKTEAAICCEEKNYKEALKNSQKYIDATLSYDTEVFHFHGKILSKTWKTDLAEQYFAFDSSLYTSLSRADLEAHMKKDTFLDENLYLLGQFYYYQRYNCLQDTTKFTDNTRAMFLHILDMWNDKKGKEYYKDMFQRDFLLKPIFIQTYIHVYYSELSDDEKQELIEKVFLYENIETPLSKTYRSSYENAYGILWQIHQDPQISMYYSMYAYYVSQCFDAPSSIQDKRLEAVLVSITKTWFSLAPLKPFMPLIWKLLPTEFVEIIQGFYNLDCGDDLGGYKQKIWRKTQKNVQVYNQVRFVEKGVIDIHKTWWSRVNFDGTWLNQEYLHEKIRKKEPTEIISYILTLLIFGALFLGYIFIFFFS